ncbi:hypothetical protein MTO98_07355 [Mucilaginibacter sp. SMC90]|uniref:hypothetical protein n=1 Tax=Mucilaginibacter sp. SMC90 TaxID=2929803 RepID=UPI001FB51C92|nr:hypothetical protein [Mucilaginibacter sp. SMC90]UOE50893.1 hypothetical protein MTO98_07355 [Mucilaginibacter sp. SMC90]
MEENRIKRKISINKKGKQWKLYQSFENFISKLDRVPDAAAVQANTPGCAPQALSDMAF